MTQPDPNPTSIKSGAVIRLARYLKRAVDYIVGRADQLPFEDAEARQQFEAEMEQLRERRSARRQKGS